MARKKKPTTTVGEQGPETVVPLIKAPGLVRVMVLRPYLGSPAAGTLLTITDTPRLRTLIARGFLGQVS
jgi:hypothetical protein